MSGGLRVQFGCPQPGRHDGVFLVESNESYSAGVQVASYMRAVLRTIAQCHSQHLLHRDIKPGANFFLL